MLDIAAKYRSAEYCHHIENEASIAQSYYRRWPLSAKSKQAYFTAADGGENDYLSEIFLAGREEMELFWRGGIELRSLEINVDADEAFHHSR